MDKRFLKRQSQASRNTGSAALAKPWTPVILLVMSATCFWAASNPIDYNKSTSMTGQARMFDKIARNPSPYVRLLFDIPLGLLFGGGGIFLLTRGASALARNRPKSPGSE